MGIKSGAPEGSAVPVLLVTPVVLLTFNVIKIRMICFTLPQERLWRKNRRRQNGICRGVDLNRNWNANFGGLCFVLY